MQIYAMGITDIEFDLPTSFFRGKLSEVSPIGRIPVLQLEDGIIPESEVIAEYLDDLYPDRSLLGETPRMRADVRLISRIADTYLMNNIFMVLPQINRKTRVDAIRDLLIGQVNRVRWSRSRISTSSSAAFSRPVMRSSAWLGSATPEG